MVRKEIIACVKSSGIGVLPTDTIYGVVGSALKPMAVERLYTVRGRQPKKPFIVLIASVADLALFGVHPATRTRALLSKLWPGPVSVILSCPGKKFAYLHRGTGTIAFRVPGSPKLRAFLKKTGPLAAPSANIAGKPPATTAREAYTYFKGTVDFYIDGGEHAGAPSSLIEVKR
jgi:L-threonylcarbamoyladenylate synthase